jgi:hypothetical protein
VQLLAPDPNDDNPIQVPFGCFDDMHHRLGPDDYVLGFTRVYAYDTSTNTNPIITNIDVDGQLQDPGKAVVTTTACTASRRADCPSVHIGPVVPATSWECNTEVVDKNMQSCASGIKTPGPGLGEEIWVDFYSSFGSFSNSARILYDPSTGSIGGPGTTDTKFEPPSQPGSGFIWIVVHDDRGGAVWSTVSVTVH